MSVLLTALLDSCIIKVFILQTLNLIRLYFISSAFKYTFMPNFATAWETGGKILETLPWEQPWAVLLKYQCRNPNYFTCYPQNGWGVKEILYLMWPLAVLFTCHNYKGATLRANISYLITLNNYSNISLSASHGDILQAEYMETPTFVTRHNRPFWTKSVLIVYIWIRMIAFLLFLKRIFLFNVDSNKNMPMWLPSST